MKGYYTVQLAGGDFATRERICLEARYVEALEKLLGGSEATCKAVLEAAQGGGSRAALERACEAAQSAAWADETPPADAAFKLRAWTAVDL